MPTLFTKSWKPVWLVSNLIYCITRFLRMSLGLRMRMSLRILPAKYKWNWFSQKSTNEIHFHRLGFTKTLQRLGKLYGKAFLLAMDLLL